MTVLDVLSSSEVPHVRRRTYFLGAPFDNIERNEVLNMLKACGPSTPFRYVVTPNVDHVVRMKRDNALAPYYDHAWLSLCDSQPVSKLAKLVSLNLPLVTGSDLTATVFTSIIQSGDRITLIAANDRIVDELERAYPGVQFRAFVPPGNVWSDPAAFQACVDFVVAEPARFVFIAIGAPQSEKIAHAISAHPGAKGVGFCIGASLEFITGAKKRAPIWMRRVGVRMVASACERSEKTLAALCFCNRPACPTVSRGVGGPIAPGHAMERSNAITRFSIGGWHVPAARPAAGSDDLRQ